MLLYVRTYSLIYTGVFDGSSQVICLPDQVHPVLIRAYSSGALANDLIIEQFVPLSLLDKSINCLRECVISLC